MHKIEIMAYSRIQSGEGPSRKGFREELPSLTIFNPLPSTQAWRHHVSDKVYRRAQMTLVVAIKARDGIVLAGDSRGTIGDPRGLTAINDTQQKVHHLGNHGDRVRWLRRDSCGACR
jgi:hypothetical protein